MLNIIKTLFEDNEYSSQNMEDGILFSKIDSSNKIDFWFVIDKNDIDLVVEEDQERIFSKCKEINNTELKKNISMLVIWDTGGTMDFVYMKKKIIQIEENPYYFKKHVLYYSPKELEELNSQISNTNIDEFFLTNISNELNFADYKANPMQKSWRELFYRIVIKLPFIKINIDSSSDIESLQQSIYNKLQQNTDIILDNLNNKVFELYEEVTNDEIENKNTLEIVNDLLNILEEGEINGN